MNDIAIQVEGLGKKYVLGDSTGGNRFRYKSLRDTIASTFSTARRRERKAPSQDAILWALKDVGFEIRHGETVGIIGHNGSGKSTLLKILSRITEPSTGQAEVIGRVGSLLEVGTGFHPELTGHENIFMNGAILGMRKSEIVRKFDEIVEFAEMQRFIDTPVKRYSSGMYMRLAFAVAAHLEPEILVVDEVLAVGDMAFQKKCLGKMGDVARGGRTVLFVSHNMLAVQTLCTRGLLLDHGRIVCDDTASVCLQKYKRFHETTTGSIWLRGEHYSEKPLEIRRVSLTLRGEQPEHKLELEVALHSRSHHLPAFVAFHLQDSLGNPILEVLPTAEGFIFDSTADHLAKVLVHLPPLIPGRYSVSAWVGSHYTDTLDHVLGAIHFEIEQSPMSGRTVPHSPLLGSIVASSRLEYQTLGA